MGSSRLPEKMMINLGGYPILEWVVNRVLECKIIDKIAIVTTINRKDDIIADFCKKKYVDVFRGDENDVLGRFYKASQFYKADRIIRVCADNPFISHIEISRLINYFNTNSFDYVCNHKNVMNSEYADGFGAEMFSFNLLKKLNKSVVDEYEREHVTLHLHRNANNFNMSSLVAHDEVKFPNLRFDIDTKEDLEKLEILCQKGVNFKSSASEIIKLQLSLNY